MIVDKNVTIFGPRTLASQIGSNLMLEPLLATLSLFFGILAAVLAAVGLFEVLAWSVSQRQREIGIRMALGARPGEVAWTMVRDVVLFTGLGLAAGLPAALAAGRLMPRVAS